MSVLNGKPKMNFVAMNIYCNTLCNFSVVMMCEMVFKTVEILLMNSVKTKKWMMNINLKKPKIMIMQKHNSKTKNLNFFLGDKYIDMTSDMTNEYTYLGPKMAPNNKFGLATKSNNLDNWTRTCIKAFN